MKPCFWIKTRKSRRSFNAIYSGEEPHIFGELLTKDEVINALNKIPAKAE